MRPVKNIVLTTDFSPNANAAMPYAAAIAKRYHATIHLIFALDHEELEAFTAGIVIGVSAWIAARRHECEERLHELVKELKERHGVNAVGVCVAGNPVREILKYAKKSADLIVIATHGRTGVPHLILGSVAELVTRLSDVPVLTVRPGEVQPGTDFQFKTILLPTDFSQNAAAAEPYALELARQNGGKILLAHVVDDSIYYVSDVDVTAMNAGDIEKWMKMMALDADKKLAEKAAVLARESGLVVEPVRLVGRITVRLLELAETRQVDLIAISTHGYTGLSHLVYGSTAEKIVQSSPVPVLSIKPANPS